MIITLVFVGILGTFLVAILLFVGVPALKKEIAIQRVATQNPHVKPRFARTDNIHYFADVGSASYFLQDVSHWDGARTIYKVYDSNGNLVNKSFAAWLVRELEKAKDEWSERSRRARVLEHFASRKR